MAGYASERPKAKAGHAPRVILVLDDAASDLGEHGHAKRILFCEIARYGPEHRAVLGSLEWNLREFA